MILFYRRPSQSPWLYIYYILPSLSSLFFIYSFEICVVLRGGGGGTQGGVPDPRYVFRREKGSFFKTSACPRFCKRRVLLCTHVRSMGVRTPLQSTKFQNHFSRKQQEKSAGKIIIGTYSIKINFFSISLVMSGKIVIFLFVCPIPNRYQYRVS